ncbi:hypothetical protein [Thermogemmatispora sp.]|uniref:hypothetical protein n=1 Tax=Thermogemmatispora sp. TaxID=1968838 RepID=UPI001DD397E2|nr:hypothetical protein [Thermogemmatispora sp.]MBX5449111.1 hypothetical protein [Thermogemmatispora sp.]
MSTIDQYQSGTEVQRFHLKRSAYVRNSLLALLTAIAFLLAAMLLVEAGCWLWGSYSHSFTLYLKWQDVLLALLLYLTLSALAGCLMSLRYLHALRMGYRRAMLLIDEQSLTVRDLSHKNLGSIFWMIGTTLLCFLAVLSGLLPLILLGWTQSWADPVLAALGTGLLLLLSLPGLAVSVGMLALLACILVSCFSLARQMGAPRTYRLDSHTSLWIHDFMLSILSPGEPESLLELQLLSHADQQRLLALLRKRWIDADRPWNPALGDEIEAALAEVQQQQLALSA